MLQAYVLSVSSVRFKCSIWVHMLLWLYPHVSSVLYHHMFQTFVASVLCGYCKNISRCCICYYAYTRMFLALFQVFHLFKMYDANVSLDVSKVDRGVARRWCLLLLLQAQPWVNPRGFLVRVRGCGPAMDAGVGAGQDADVGAWAGIRMWAGIRTWGVGRDTGEGAASKHDIPSSRC
jgi:hypothetical protein